MGAETAIAWCDSTFNPFLGCTPISPGCDNCYAQALDHRWGHDHRWGAGAPRDRTSADYWKKPRAWNAQAAKLKHRRRVFCASFADVFDGDVPQEWRDDLWALIRETPWLDWQVVTKRPSNFRGMLPKDWGKGYPNVWLIVTAEDQTRLAQRVPILLNTPAAVHGVSYEPSIGGLDLFALPEAALVDWIIIGGESGPKARPFSLAWGEHVLEWGEHTRTAIFVKQMGEVAIIPEPDWRAGRYAIAGGVRLLNGSKSVRARTPAGFVPLKFTGKGDDPAEWPELFRVRQFPRSA